MLESISFSLSCCFLPLCISRRSFLQTLFTNFFLFFTVESGTFDIVGGRPEGTSHFGEFCFLGHRNSMCVRGFEVFATGKGDRGKICVEFCSKSVHL